MRRRRFLRQSGCGLAAPWGHLAWRGRGWHAEMAPREVAGDVVIVGGGLGGCAAALAVLRNGRTVVLTEVTDWIGGQLTSQAVPPDEHPWIERFGSSASYRKLRHEIRAVLSASLSLDGRGPIERSLEPRQRGGLGTMPRAQGCARRPDFAPGTLCFQREAGDAARARADRRRGAGGQDSSRRRSRSRYTG